MIAEVVQSASSFTTLEAITLIIVAIVGAIGSVVAVMVSNWRTRRENKDQHTQGKNLTHYLVGEVAVLGRTVDLLHTDVKEIHDRQVVIEQIVRDRH